MSTNLETEYFNLLFSKDMERILEMILKAGVRGELVAYTITLRVPEGVKFNINTLVQRETGIYDALLYFAWKLPEIYGEIIELSIRCKKGKIYLLNSILGSLVKDDRFSMELDL